MQESFPELGIKEGSPERLEVNPFPEILSNEEFKEAMQSGRTFFERYMLELDADAHEQLRKDKVYEAGFTRLIQNQFSKDFMEGKVTEDFSDTILLEDPTAITGEPRKIAALEKGFEKLETIKSQYDEEVSPQDLFDLYEQDLTGRSIIRSIAIEKVRHAAFKLKEDDVRDLLGTDVGVLVPYRNVELLTPPADYSEEPIKPTHRWLRKPNTEVEMAEMLRGISGNKITIMVAVAVRYRVLRSGPDTYRWHEVVFTVPIRNLSEAEISEFVKKHFEAGKNIAGGVDYTSYGYELVEGGIKLPYESIVTPVKEIKKLWAEVQVIKRAAHLHSKEFVVKVKK